jgi:gluconolactonase
VVAQAADTSMAPGGKPASSTGERSSFHNDKVNTMTNFRELATGLRFPEGPVALPDGSLLVVEIARRTLSRISPDGKVSVVAQTGGGPNGAALGPDGKVYVCNNGGFEWIEDEHGLRPGLMARDYDGGRIERVDLSTGKIERLYERSDKRNIRGPNDIVFDRTGGFWFTDPGKNRDSGREHGGVYYVARGADKPIEVVYPMAMPNGIGLSPDEDRLYVAETITGRLWSFELASPGVIKRKPHPSPNGGELLAGLPGYQLFDSLAVDSAGNICIATLPNGGITVISPDGKSIAQIPVPDAITTNICFGGPDLRTAFITCSASGKVLTMQWPRPGLPLNWLNK